MVREHWKGHIWKKKKKKTTETWNGQEVGKGYQPEAEAS